MQAFCCIPNTYIQGLDTEQKTYELSDKLTGQGLNMFRGDLSRISCNSYLTTELLTGSLTIVAKLLIDFLNSAFI